MSIYEHTVVCFSTTVCGCESVLKREGLRWHFDLCVTVHFLQLCVCFHRVRPYKALTIIVLSIDFGAWVYTQDSATCLKAGCGLTPTKFPKHRSPRRELFWGLEAVMSERGLTPPSVHHWVYKPDPILERGVVHVYKMKHRICI